MRHLKSKPWRIALTSWLIFTLAVVSLASFFVFFGEDNAAEAAGPRSIDCSANPTISQVEGAPSTNQFNSGDDLTLTTSGTCTLTIIQVEGGAASSISLNSLTIDTGVTLTHAVADTTAGQHNELDLVVTGAVVIEGSINVDGKGYLGAFRGLNDSNNGRTNGNTTVGGSSKPAYSNYSSGGSHGGRGGRGGTDPYGPVADSYDSIVNPILPGSGGGSLGASYRKGGSGGGVVIISAATVTINGTISAKGDVSLQSEHYASAGGGGTINITSSGALTTGASAVIVADGGNGTTSDETAGGGGRIALVYGTDAIHGSTTITAYSGDGSGSVPGGLLMGSAGTIFRKLAVASGDLYINTKDSACAESTGTWCSYYATEIDSSNDAVFQNVYLQNYGRLFVESTATDFSTTLLQVAANSVFESDIAMTFPSLSATTLYLNGGIAKFDNTLTLAAFDTTSGVVTGILNSTAAVYVSSGDVILGSGLTWQDESTLKKDAGTILTSMTIKSGGILSTSGCGTSAAPTVNLTLGTLTVDLGGSINVDGKGYLGAHNFKRYYDGGIYLKDLNTPTPVVSSYYGRTNGNTITGGSFNKSGGSHGGMGGFSVGDQVADSYDSIVNPTLPGSGGGSNQWYRPAGNGGGVVIVSATSVTINGTISANGAVPYVTQNNSGAGGGGTINITSSGVLTTGADAVIAVNGGDATAADSSRSGGGGRVALVYGTNAIHGSTAITAYGGDGYSTTAGYDGAAGTVFRKLVASSYGDLYINNTTRAYSYYTTSLLTTIPTNDKVYNSQGSLDSYAFNSIIVSNYGILNIPEAIETPVRYFFCDSCSADNDTASDGEIVYNTPLYSSGVAADYTCLSGNAAPTVSINSVTPRTDGTGKVDISVTANDADLNDLKLMVKYSVIGDCSDVNYASLDTDAGATATYPDSGGTPSVTAPDADHYQIGLTDTRKVDTNSGANTVTFIWNSATDLATANATTYCVTVVPHDGSVAGTANTLSGITLDNVAPVSLGNLTLSSVTTSSIIVTLGAAATDTRIYNYKIYYKAAASGVAETDTLSTTIATADYTPSGTKTISGLNPNTQYVMNIWAYDTYGNKLAGSEISYYTAATAPTIGTVVPASTTSLTVPFNVIGNPASTEFAIYTPTTIQYVQANGTLGASAVWQTNATWGTGTTTVSGLAVNTSYQFQIKARNGDNTATALSTASTGVYTLAAQVTGLTAENSTTKTAYRISLAWSGGGTGIKIEQDTGCNGYETTAYDNTTTNSSPYVVTGLSANICYRFRVSSYNVDGTINSTSPTETAEVGVTMPAGQPTGFAALSNTTTSITWVWSAVSGATDYELYNAGDDSLIGNVGSTTTAYVQESLTPNTQHTVYVRAVNAQGTGIASSSASAYTEANMPTILGATNQSTEGLRWTWTSGGAQKDFWAQTSADVHVADWTTDLFWNQSSLTANIPMTVSVKARNEGLEPTGSASIIRYTLQNTPTGVSSVAVLPTSVQMSADGSFPNLDLGSSGLYFVNSTSVTNSGWVQTNSWTNSGLSANTAYTYKVRANNGDNQSTDYSDPVTVIYTAQNVPSGVSVSAKTTESISLSADGTLPSIDSGNSGLLFANTTTPGNSGWLQVNAWTNSALSANTAYTYKVRGRNGDQVETVDCSDTIFYTYQNTPTGVTASAKTSSSITLTADGSLGNLTADDSGLYFVNQTSVTNSTWTQTNSWADGGLAANTSYTYKVRARNGDAEPTDYSGTEAIYTAQTTPTSVTVSTFGVNSLIVTANGAFVNETVGSSGFWFENVTAGTNSGWIQTTSWTSDNLDQNTTYQFKVKVRNASGEPTAYTDEASLSTLAARRADVPPPADTGSTDTSTRRQVVTATPIAIPDYQLVEIPVTQATETVVDISSRNGRARFISSSGSEQTISVTFVNMDNRSVDVTIQSDSTIAPLKVQLVNPNNSLKLTIKEGEEKKIDSNGDGIPDYTVSLDKIESSLQVKLSISAFAPTAVTPTLPEVTPPAEEPPPVQAEIVVPDQPVSVPEIIVPVRAKPASLLKEGQSLVKYVQLFKKLPKKGEDWTIIHFLAYGTIDKIKALSLTDRVNLLKQYATKYGNYPKVEADWVIVKQLAEGTVATPAPVTKVTTSVGKLTRYICTGSVGTEVRTLQTILINLGYLKIDKTTGQYAAKTQAAIKQFQSDNKLKPITGCVGPATRAALNARAQ